MVTERPTRPPVAGLALGALLLAGSYEWNEPSRARRLRGLGLQREPGCHGLRTGGDEDV